MSGLDKYFYKNLATIIVSLESIDNSLKKIEQSLSKTTGVSTYVPNSSVDISYNLSQKEQKNED